MNTLIGSKYRPIGPSALGPSDRPGPKSKKIIKKHVHDPSSHEKASDRNSRAKRCTYRHHSSLRICCASKNPKLKNDENIQTLFTKNKDHQPPSSVLLLPALSQSSPEQQFLQYFSKTISSPNL